MEPQYRCWYCPVAEPEFAGVVQHCIAEHGDKTLKIRKQTFNQSTGNFEYHTKHYRVIPSELESVGKYICPLANEKVRIEASTTSRSPAKKKPRAQQTHQSSEDLDTDTDTDDEDVDADIAEFQRLLPVVVTQLRDAGVIKPWLQFHKLVQDGTFPLNNIAFLLFLDVVRFYSCESTSQMRYHHNIKDFWYAGYRLFHDPDTKHAYQGPT
jgi:hypothetical protein